MPRLCAALLLAALAVPAIAAAQGPDDLPLSPPPLVPAPPPEDIGPPPPPPLPEGVPPPALEPPRARPPAQPKTGYPYSPAPPVSEPPGPEVGLMISEGLFGMLTAAGVTLLPYFLLLRPMMFAGGAGLGIDPAIGTVIFILLFAAVPLATSQTVVSLANGSRHYQVDGWPAALVGLGVEALAVALFFLIRAADPLSGATSGISANEWLLLINTIAVVPGAQVLITNLVKKPRVAAPPLGAALNYRPGKGLYAGLPIPAPITGILDGRSRTGLLFPLISGVL